MIVKCSCKNQGQDTLHGKGKRVANQKQKGGKMFPLASCTVCKKEHKVNTKFY